jgi:predicted GNAT family N-acyltransferase
MTAHVRAPIDAKPLSSLDAVYEVQVARRLEEILQAVAVRSLVYMGEQRCPFAEEYDGNDFAGATHLILSSKGEPIGTLRLRWFAGFAKLERVAIRSEHRGGAGARVLIDAAFALAARKGYRKMIGHAQERLTPFWKRYRAKPRPGRDRFVFSDHEYVEIEAELEARDDALTEDADPIVLLRPEGDWDRPGVLDRSVVRPATNPHERRCAR